VKRGLAPPPKGKLARVSGKTIVKALDRLQRLALFQKDEYVELNPDVPRYFNDPYRHAVCFGAWEGRQLFRHERIARVLGESRAARDTEDADHVDDVDLARIVREMPEVGVYVNSHGNLFLTEIADGLADDLRAVGVRVSKRDESSSIDGRPPICIFVAPHEFFVLGAGKEWIRDDVLKRSFMFTTEQLQTPWFKAALPFALCARGVLDIVSQTARLFEQASIPSLHFEPTARPVTQWLEPNDEQHPLIRILPQGAKQPRIADRPLKDRPLDVCFFGAETPDREDFFSRQAAFFADYDVFFNYRRAQVPIKKGTQDAALTRIAGHVCGNSKISLNLHRDVFGYFEWHRIVKLAMSSGSVVVSEPCLPHPVYRPGIHYFEEVDRRMPDLIEWLIRSTDGQRRAEEVRNNALSALAAASSPSRNGERVARFLYRHAP
jgi:hypothetical protein